MIVDLQTRLSANKIHRIKEKARKAMLKCNYEDGRSIYKSSLATYELARVHKTQREDITVDMYLHYSRMLMFSDRQMVHTLIINMVNILESQEKYNCIYNIFKASETLLLGDIDSRLIKRLLVENPSDKKMFTTIYKVLLESSDPSNLNAFLIDYPSNHAAHTYIFESFFEALNGHLSEGKAFKCDALLSHLLMSSPLYNEKYHSAIEDSVWRNSKSDVLSFIKIVIRSSNISPENTFKTVNRFNDSDLFLNLLSDFPELGEKAREILVKNAGWTNELTDDWYVKTLLKES